MKHINLILLTYRRIIFKMFKICHKNTSENDKHDLSVFNVDYESVSFRKLSCSLKHRDFID